MVWGPLGRAKIGIVTWRFRDKIVPSPSNTARRRLEIWTDRGEWLTGKYEEKMYVTGPTRGNKQCAVEGYCATSSTACGER